MSSRDADIADTPAPFSAAALFLAVIALGAIAGLLAPAYSSTFSEGADATLLLLIFLLMFELRLGAVFKAFGNTKVLGLAWAANFLLVPVIGFGIASLIFSGQPLLFVGLMIYFLAPCTDWFLGFTRLAKGDTEVGAALIPINMVTQILLFPLWLWLFAQSTGLVEFEAMPNMLLQWFILPLACAQALRFACSRFLPQAWNDRVLSLAASVIPFVLAALIFQLFATHIGVIALSWSVIALVILAVCMFFGATFATGEILSRVGGLSHKQRVLLSMTMAARNAPLMLALTAIAIPDQPLVLAVIVAGMLIEIPLLTALKQVLVLRNPER